MAWKLTQDKIITERQVNKLLKEVRVSLDAALARGTDLKYLNDYFLIAIAWNTGLRASEISDLEWSDISFDEHYLIVRSGKGGKKRTVQYGQTTTAILQEFKELQTKHFKRECKDGAIFVNQRRDKLKRGGIHLRFKLWVTRAGLPKNLSFHSMRHGFATRLIHAGIPIHVVKEQLGHANINITSVYLHFTEASKAMLGKVI